MKDWALIGLCCLMGSVLCAQVSDEVDRAVIIEQRIEQIAESTEDEDLDYTTLFELLTVYIDFPLNLNTATPAELYGLGLLSNYQVGQFLDYREKYGFLVSKFELAYVDGWSGATAQLIEPFVQVGIDQERDRVTFPKMWKYGKSEVVVRWQRILEDQKGYLPITPEALAASPNSRYLGSPDRIFTRYRYRYSDRVSFGVTAEKDNGEEFFRGSQPQGFDFYSGHLFLKDFGKVKRLAIGDFQAQFGQGLTFWSGLGFNRKSSFTLSTAQIANGIGPYTSINENLFLRGGAITVNQGAFDLSFAYSDKRIDGNITQPTDSLDTFNPELAVSSFQESGYHRTRNEMEDKDAISQQHLVGNLSYNREKIHIGVTAAQMQLDGRVAPTTQEYSRFRFSGTDNSVIGADYMWKPRNFFLFGETSRSANGAWATVNGLNINMNPRLSVNITQRYYARNFQPVASVAFGEGSSVENESGIYLGTEFRPFKKWKLNAFVDQFRFPWLRYLTDAPSSGYDFLAQLEYQPSSRFDFYIRYRNRLRSMNTRDENVAANYLVDVPREGLRVNMSYRVSRQLRFRSRVELSRYQRGDEPRSDGFMVYQDVQYDFPKWPIKFSLRYALFDTDSYDSRIYAYENDVLYFFSIPAYSGRGTRVYALVSCDLGRHVDLWLRWGQFYYTDRNVISSGNEEIQGNVRNDVRVQVRWKF